MNSARPNRPVTGRTVLYCLLGFFGVVFAMNLDGQQRLEHGPQLIGNTEPGRGVLIGHTWSTAFLRFCFVHTLQYNRLFG